MFTLLTSLFTIVGFALTKGIWIFGAYTLVRKYDVVNVIKARVQDSSEF